VGGGGAMGGRRLPADVVDFMWERINFSRFLFIYLYIYIPGELSRTFMCTEIKFWAFLQNKTRIGRSHLPCRPDMWVHIIRNCVKQLNTYNQCFLSQIGPNSGSHVTKRTVMVVL
jgi:hypothetical protein